MAEPAGSAVALERLDETTRRLRRECPWDREQDERSIVPHTVEEAYELADAAGSGDDAKLIDELGDVLFQVHFLSLLLEERGAGSLGEVAEHCRQKLIRRHPHVFGDAQLSGAEEVLANWDRIKRTEERPGDGPFGEVPANLPGLLYARKLQRRATSGASGGREGAEAHLAEVGVQAERLSRAASRSERFDAVGDLLFAAVAAARAAEVDPELAVRAAADRFRARVERDGGGAVSEAGGA